MTHAHEARSLPCSHCGAPLPVNPLAAWAYCPRCQRATVVPDALRAAALAYQRAVHDAWQLRRAREREAAEARAAAQQQEDRKKPFDVAIMFWVALEIIPLLLTTLLMVVVWIPAALEGEPLGVQIGAVIVALGAGLLLTAGAVKLTIDWRSRTRRVYRRAAGGGLPAETAAAFGAGRARGAEAASCGVCGAPLAFRVGEHRIACGHCGSVVMPCTGTRRDLVKLALREADVALWERASAERRKRRAEAALARRRLLFLGLAFGGSLMCVAPLGLLVWAVVHLVRRITFGVEDLVDEFAAGIGADLDRGEEPMAGWLDAYWIDEEPAILQRADGMLGVRWSAMFWYAGRPAMLTVLSDWTDGRADTITLLYAHPADRPRGPAGWSAAADQARALGYAAELSRAGVALTASSLPAAVLTAPNLHALVAVAHGIAAAPAR